MTGLDLLYQGIRGFRNRIDQGRPATRAASLTTLQEVAGGGVLALVKTGTGTVTLGTAAKRLPLADGVSMANPILVDTGAGS